MVCVNWRNYLGRGEEYVSKLKSMVSRHLTVPHKFVCLTERELGEEKTGWWVKLKVPELLTGPVLYLDLDLIITENIDHLVRLAESAPEKVWMRDDFSYSIVKKVDPNPTMAMMPGTCNSSVMLWSEMPPLPERWPAAWREAHGDQNILTAWLWPQKKIALLPNDSIKSYKYHWQRGEGYGPITVFHGNPKPHQVRDDWVREHWN